MPDFPRRTVPYRRRHIGHLPLALCLAAITTVTAFSQSGGRPQPVEARDPHPNFDIRTYKADPRWEQHPGAAAFMERFRPADQEARDLAMTRVAGTVALERRFRGVRIEKHSGLGTNEIVSASPGMGLLTGPSGNRVANLRGFMREHAPAYGLTRGEVDQLEVVADYANPRGNMRWVEFEQRFNGIPVFQGLVRGGFTSRGELVRTTGVLAAGIQPGRLSRIPSVSAAQAVAIAAGHVGWDVPEASLVEKPSPTANHVSFEPTPLAGETSAWLVYFPLAEGAARLAWATQMLGDPYGFLTVVDGETGDMLFRKNLTDFQTQSASYTVYASDSPAPASPSPALPGANYQAPYVPRQTFTLVGNEGPLSFNNLGWMTDGTNETAGNNVIAGLDRVSPNGIDATVPGVSRVFNFAYDPETQEPLTPAYQNGEVTDMFYWSNRYHDELYLLGFTEAARNFQNDNFGRGGAGNDRVLAEGQDYSGTNNANFSTPADGSSGRMQMYIFPGPTPDRTSGIDHDVLIHELTHGTSNRLHNNASGLTTTMSRGMGEGWSDFYARALLSDASEDVNGIYTTGGWVTYLIGTGFTDNYYYGIRRFPYAVRSATGGPMNRPFNPLTFADIDPTQINLSDGAYPRGPIGSRDACQVHNIGEVWASALVEVRARFITRLGYAVGNQRILQFVTDGMKLDPVGPTLLQGRDAILAAAVAAGNDPADIADIWDGFATRGMGVLASVSNPNTCSVTENFLRPGDPTPSFSIDDVSQAEGNAGTTTFTFMVNLANPTPGVEHRVSFATADGTASSDGITTTFSTATPTTIPAGAPTATSGPASPYPLTLDVSGVTGTILDLDVRIDGLTHTWPDDLDFLLVAPGGQAMIVQSDGGGSGDVSNVTYTLDDEAAASFPTGQITAGTFRPHNLGADDPFPAPAPGAPYANPAPAGSATLNGAFGGTDPNGTWRLYIVDDAGGDSGALAGFSLIVTVPNPAADYQRTFGQLVFPAGTTSLPVSVTVNGDLTPEADETFFVNLSNPINAIIGDGEGLGTIVDDDALGRIIVEKQTNPDGGSGSFAFSSSPNVLSGSIGDGQTLEAEVMPGSYVVTEADPAPGFDLTGIVCSDTNSVGDVATRRATFNVAPGETVRCIFTNTERGRVEVKKLTNGGVNPTLDIKFTLYQTAGDPYRIDTDVSLETVSTLNDADGILAFGPRLVPDRTYTVCENPVPAGWTSLWTIGFTLNGQIVTPYNPNALDSPPQDLGVRCVNFAVDPGATAQFEVHNDFPGGDPRTIGYWKNWSSCTAGNQAENAARNGGAAAGFYLLDDVLPQGIGDFNVTTCQRGVYILSKQDQSGRNRASDAAYEVAAQLLATRANLAVGAAACSSIQTAVLSAQALLDAVNFTGSGAYLPPNSRGAQLTRRREALALAAMLDQYNNGRLCTAP